MRIRSITGLWLGRMTKWVLWALGRKGTSLPGLVAARVAPRLLEELLNQLSTCVIVTGTNGKTTTTAFLYAFLNDGEAWLTNRGGANLQQGLLAALLAKSDWWGRLQVKKAVLEVDEATLPKVTAKFHPQAIVVTNVLRDQLDRYGEVDLALRMLSEGTRYAGTALITNADDPLAMSLGLGRPELTYYYGMTGVVDTTARRTDVRDGAFCLICGRELEYAYFIYGQIGAYRCPEGHFERPQPTFAGRWERAGRRLVVCEAEPNTAEEFTVESPVRGVFNQYNLLAAASAARVLGVSPKALRRRVQNFAPPTGRFQVFPGAPERVLVLIKNPTGANGVLRALEDDAAAKAVCFVINDDDADGRDVSWLWDINLEEFIPCSRAAEWLCGGTRGLDMALRLAYAGIERTQIRVLDKLAQVAEVSADGVETVYILSTYTALHPLSDLLKEVANRG